jgi:GntR family transcriptional regulator
MSPVIPIPIHLSSASGVPFYKQIFDQMAEAVCSGELLPDSVLPSVRDLSQALLVSLITVRRAYADLEAGGLIIRRQGQGTFVASKIEAATRRRSRGEAQDALGEAVQKARRLGLSAEEISATVQEALAAFGGRDE